VAGGRSHGLLPHTADAGFTARARDLAALFEEGARALAELGADLDEPAFGADPLDSRGGPSAGRVTLVVGPLSAHDLEALAFAWLNELLGVAEARGLALVGAQVSRIERVAPGEGVESRWVLDGTAALAPYGPDGVRPRRHVKAVTFHRLAVAREAPGWTLTAYADL
jgi:SHS2 domain-containing protein